MAKSRYILTMTEEEKAQVKRLQYLSGFQTMSDYIRFKIGLKPISGRRRKTLKQFLEKPIDKKTG